MEGFLENLPRRAGIGEPSSQSYRVEHVPMQEAITEDNATDRRTENSNLLIEAIDKKAVVVSGGGGFRN